MNEELEELRARARADLDEQWAAGRIDPAEHERRTTALRNATSAQGIEDAQRGPASTEVARVPAPIPPVAEPRSAASGSSTEVQTTGGVLSRRQANAIAAATPMLAAIVFFVLGFGLEGWGYAWIAFLFIPLVESVLPAVTAEDPGRASRRAERRALKSERRALEREELRARRAELEARRREAEGQ